MSTFLILFLILLAFVIWMGRRSHTSPSLEIQNREVLVAPPKVLKKSPNLSRKPRSSQVASNVSPEIPSKKLKTTPKSQPSVQGDARPKVGSGTGKWRDPIYFGEQDFSELALLLEKYPGLSARSLARIAPAALGGSFDKHRINSGLYRMWHRGLVERKMVGQVPHWYLI